ncbi:hypothetical protein ACS0TY_024017 [Phlomoides rotata]
MESLFRRLTTERVLVHVHDIIIKGNTRTKDSLIESETEEVLRGATTFQQLLCTLVLPTLGCVPLKSLIRLMLHWMQVYLSCLGL